MVRVLRLHNYGVYVADERGERHHSPHAHIKFRGQRIASIHLVSLEMLKQIAPVPAEVMELIRDHQEALIAEWERLNS
jgi:Domain of unknown function (DUF4160)